MISYDAYEVPCTLGPFTHTALYFEKEGSASVSS